METKRMLPDYMFSYVINIVVIGPDGSGKTSLIRQFAESCSTSLKPFPSASAPTTSVVIPAARLQADTEARFSSAEISGSCGSSRGESSSSFKGDHHRLGVGASSAFADLSPSFVSEYSSSPSIRSLLRWIAGDITYSGSIEAAVENFIMLRAPQSSTPYDWVSSLLSNRRRDGMSRRRNFNSHATGSWADESSGAEGSDDTSDTTDNYPESSAGTTSADDIAFVRKPGPESLVLEETSENWTTAPEFPSSSEVEGSDLDPEITIHQSLSDNSSSTLSGNSGSARWRRAGRDEGLLAAERSEDEKTLENEESLLRNDSHLSKSLSGRTRSTTDALPLEISTSQDRDFVRLKQNVSFSEADARTMAEFATAVSHVIISGAMEDTKRQLPRSPVELPTSGWRSPENVCPPDGGAPDSALSTCRLLDHEADSPPCATTLRPPAAGAVATPHHESDITGDGDGDSDGDGTHGRVDTSHGFEPVVDSDSMHVNATDESRGKSGLDEDSNKSDPGVLLRERESKKLKNTKTRRKCVENDHHSRNARSGIRKIFKSNIRDFSNDVNPPVANQPQKGTCEGKGVRLHHREVWGTPPSFITPQSSREGHQPESPRPQRQTATQTSELSSSSGSSSSSGEGKHESSGHAGDLGDLIKVNVTDASGDWSRFLQLRGTLTHFHAVFLVYDVTDRSSFAEAVAWVLGMESASTYRPDVITLVGNKADTGDRKVLLWEGDYLARYCGMRYVETAADRKDCIANAFCATVLDVLNRLPARDHTGRLHLSRASRDSFREGSVMRSRLTGNESPGSAQEWGSESLQIGCTNGGSQELCGTEEMGNRACCLCL